MITAFLLYIGKVAILLAVFYLFYRLLMERETFHRFNRAILLLSVLIAFILPLCEITLHKTVWLHPRLHPGLMLQLVLYRIVPLQLTVIPFYGYSLSIL